MRWYRTIGRFSEKDSILFTAVQGIEPGTAGWEARTLPLCYAVPPPFALHVITPIFVVHCDISDNRHIYCKLRPVQWYKKHLTFPSQKAKPELFRSAEIRTWDCWPISLNTTSVLCCPWLSAIWEDCMLPRLNWSFSCLPSQLATATHSTRPSLCYF